MTEIARTTYLLPPAAYTSQAWFDAEREQLFEHIWNFVALVHDVPEPGDFVTASVGRASIIIVRGKDGEIRAFHNMCRHRGLQIVDGSGSCPKGFVCPYHRWNYATDGRLRSVPQRDEFPELELGELGLLAARCEIWKGMVYVNLDDGAPSLVEWLGDFPSKFERFHPERLVELHRVRHEVAANWKLYVENHVDWLHLWYLHADTLDMYDHPNGERFEFGHHWSSFEGRVGGVTEEPGDVGLVPLPDLEPDDRRNGAHLVFPNQPLLTHAGYWVVLQAHPIDPANCEIEIRVLGVEGGDMTEFAPMLDVVMREDYAAAEAIQRNAASPAFEVGPIATDYEREIMRFHQHYLSFVDDA